MTILYKTKDEFSARLWRYMQAFPAYYDFVKVGDEYHCFEIKSPPNQRKVGPFNKLG